MVEIIIFLKKYKKNILVGAVIFMVVILLLNWLIKSGRKDRMNQVENFNAYYKSLLNQCDKEEKVYACCFDSVAYMAANNLETVNIGCRPGFKPNTFSCLGAYKWCEMIR